MHIDDQNIQRHILILPSISDAAPLECSIQSKIQIAQNAMHAPPCLVPCLYLRAVPIALHSQDTGFEPLTKGQKSREIILGFDRRET